MARKQLFTAILAIGGLAFILDGMVANTASAMKKREIHTAELLPTGDAVQCTGGEPGTCESDGLGTVAVATAITFEITSWGVTLQNLLGNTVYNVNKDPNDDVDCGSTTIYLLLTNKDGLASANSVISNALEPTVDEGEFVNVCNSDNSLVILHGDFTSGGKENVHRNNAKKR